MPASPSDSDTSDSPASAVSNEATDAPNATTAVHTTFLGITNLLIWTRASY
jgi:hypothetical protein